ncbi:MAG TPA: Spy/CpxP family protein refolding chaperone [Hyphomicrobiaceae bacterium]|nr:Spy/CpxP family protein refolding chaperone [Hyphomicrobiaceae bacterium]
MAVDGSQTLVFDLHQSANPRNDYPFRSVALTHRAEAGEDPMRTIRVVTLACTFAIVTTLAQAQGPGNDRRGWGMLNEGSGWGRMGMWGHPGRGGGPDWMLDRIEGRLAFLKQELKITEAQVAAWDGFADALRAVTTNHAERMKTLFAEREASKTLPERIEGQEVFLAMRLEGLKLVRIQLKTLYGVLSDQQKTEADDMELPMIGMLGGMCR